MTTKQIRKLVQVALFGAFAAGTISSGHAVAEATVPAVDMDGAADSQLLKRYEGSFIVSYEKFSFTEFVVPLSPLEKSADEKERDQNNNRVYTPGKKIELEGALTRIVYVLPEQRSPLEVLRNYQDVITQKPVVRLFSNASTNSAGAIPPGRLPVEARP